MTSTEDTPVSAAASDEVAEKRAKRRARKTARDKRQSGPKAKPRAAKKAGGKAAKRKNAAQAVIASAATDGETPSIHVFGDSHSKYFQPNAFHAARLGLPKPIPYHIKGMAIPASSVAGFRPGDRKLNVKDTIRAALPEASHLILAFGQVDLELGYYYRLAVKKEEQTPETYVAWLLGIYGDFVDSLNDGSTRIALKGVNLTALSPKPFAAKYVVRIIEGEERADTAEARKNLLPFILSEDEQNAMHLAFNDGLASMARARDMGYFDLIKETAAPKASPPRMADQFRPGDFDHHLVNSISVRRMHYRAAGKVFGLAPSRKG